MHLKNKYNMLRDLFILPELKKWQHGLDEPETTLLHGRIIKKKKQQIIKFVIFTKNQLIWNFN